MRRHVVHSRSVSRRQTITRVTTVDSDDAPVKPQGGVMIGWYPGWQMVLAWLAVTAVAAAIYFGPMTQLIESLGD
jgi:hypothetical protein